MQASLPPPLFTPPAVAAEQSLSLRDWMEMLWRQLGVILLCTVVVGGALAWLMAGQKSVHASTATVWVQTEQQGMPTFLSGIAAYRDSPYPDPVNRKIETEMELMVTRSAATEVIRSLGIREEQLARSPLDHLKARLKALLPKKSPARSGPAPDGATGLEELFLKGLTVTPLRSGTADTTSNLLELRFECADAELAPKALQALLNSYFRLAAQQNRTLGQSTAQLIDSQLAQARDELRSVEDKILALSVRGGAVAASTTLASPGASSGPRAPGPGGLRYDLGAELTGTVHTQAMSQLKSQAQELQAQLDQARELYTDEAENVKLLRQRLAGVQQRLAQGIAQGARMDAEMGRLERQRSLAQERFVELRKKLDQIELYLQLNPTDAASRSVVDAPSHPEADQGKSRGLLLVLGPVAGLLLGLLLAGLREFADSRLRNAQEVRRVLGLNVLGAVPSLRGARRDALHRSLG